MAAFYCRLTEIGPSWLLGIELWGPAIGNMDPGAVVMLTDVTDRLGLDVNEAGWVVGWAMECYAKGLLTRKDLDGLDLTWGNVEAAKTLLEKIARRDGVGDLLAEGVMRASRQVGPEAEKLGVYVLKGSTPRGHDHRAIWSELLDTCVSATSTIQAGSRMIVASQFGLPPISNPFSPLIRKQFCLFIKISLSNPFIPIGDL